MKKRINSIVGRLVSLTSKVQKKIEIAYARRGGKWLIAAATILLALAVGLLTSGLTGNKHRSTLFVVCTCISAPALLFLPVREKKTFICLAAAVSILFSVIFTQVVTRPGDASNNIFITYNILTHSTYTHKDTRETKPGEHIAYSSFREPVLPVTMLPFAALALNQLEDLKDPGKIMDGLSVHPYLKMATGLWGALLVLGMWKLGTFRSKHYIAVWLAVSFVTVYMLREEIGKMFTEIPASALMVWLAWAYLKSLESGAKKWLFLAGILAALLALTKMLFLYVFLASSPFLALALWWRGNKSLKQAAQVFFIPLLSFAALLCAYTGIIISSHPGIGVKDVFFSARTDDVLAFRAMKNRMTPDERLGALYAYSRGGVNTFLGLIMGLDENDVKRGGRLERLSRGADKVPIGKDGKPAAEKLFQGKWYPFDECRTYYVLAKDPKILNNAKDMILQDLPLHLAMSPLFLYRGVFGLGTGSTGLFMFVYCAVAFFGALIYRRPDNLIILWYPLATMAAYALASHFIPRYSVPMNAILLTFFCVHLAGVLQRTFLPDTLEPRAAGASPAKPSGPGQA